MGVFFAIAFFALAALGGLYFLWLRRVQREVIEGAALEWALLNEKDPELIEGYDEARFTEIYRRVHTPRFPGYALAAIAAYAVSLPAIFAALSAIAWGAERLGLTPEPVALAQYVPLEIDEAAEANEEMALYLAQDFAGFYFFFGVIFVWVAIFFLFMRHYHQNRPGFLRDELLLSREEGGETG